MEKELISVIVPIYNVEDYLEKCIDSIINQTYKNLEIILIDDGSTDHSGQICDNYKILDSRVVVIHKSNGGLSSAWNAGLDIAKGILISFVDGDDYISSNMLEELKKNMEKYNSDISICNYYRVRDNKIIKKNSIIKNNFSINNIEKFNNIYNEYSNITIPSWNKLYKKRLFKNVKFPNNIIFEDAYVICDLLNEAKDVSYVEQPLYYYVYRAKSILNCFNCNHFDKIKYSENRVNYFINKGYFELVQKEKNRKMNALIINLSKMKRYNIKNKEVYKKYYKELLDTDKEVKWKNATWKNKLFKVLRRPSISILAFGLRVRDLIRR